MKIPNKPSAAIKLALNDLKKCKEDNRYTLDMGIWHSPDAGSCEVCMAGALMAKTLSSDINKDLEPFDFDKETDFKLKGIDSFRVGNLFCLLDYFNLEDKTHLVEVRYEEFSKYKGFKNFDKSYKFYMKEANKLEALGV